GPPPNAASIAITMSPTTSISPETNSDSNRRTTAAISGPAPPAIPTQVLSIFAGEMLAAEQACRIAAPRLSRAWRSPTRMMLLPADVPLPSTEFSSPMRHEVLVPPPSMPRKMLTSVVLSQAQICLCRADTPVRWFWGRLSCLSDPRALADKSVRSTRSIGYELGTLACRLAGTAQQSWILWRIGVCAHGFGQPRSRHYCALSRRHYPVRPALPQTPALIAGLLSCRPQHSLVGDCAFDRRGRDQHTYDYQHSRPRLRYESHVSAGRTRIPRGTRHYQLRSVAALLS